ncbi:permease prefix domain 1-containing protein [Kribbella sp. NBC_01505]|uniref:permease prefix domain 1-containing protein n=1 Tax=Kribbella sp. NBC_01505 TaxID=2903580 RepID=UPI0038648F4D
MSTSVDDYLVGLTKALPGPRRKKADLLAEARDHLTDATEALEADGLDRTAAERAAVADFGDLSDVVPAYREELAVAQSRITAALLFGVLILQPLIWQPGVWSWNQDLGGPSALSVILEHLIRWVGAFTIAGAVIALLATSLGQRFALVRQHGARMIAVFAIVSAVVVSLGGMSMTLEWSLASGRLDVIPVSAFVVVPLFLVGLQARRGLRLVRA